MIFQNEIIHCNDKTCTSLTFQEKVDYNFDQEIVISEFPHVQFINLQCFSFNNATELTISNLPELIILTCQYESLRNVTKLKLESIF